MTSAEAPDTRTIFGHPRGLLVLASTEVWDRISFQTMQAILTLYLAKQLLLPANVVKIVGFHEFQGAIEYFTGPLTTRALATQVFGIYIGLVYFAPMFGGMIGDRFLGRRASIVAGGLLMTAGHFAMAFDASFLLALLLLILGAGLFRGNLTPQIGELYDREDRRRTVAFQVYGAAVNLGATIGPLVSGVLAQSYGWHIAFGFAGVGMLIGVIIYLIGGRGLPSYQPTKVVTAPKLNTEEWRTILFLLALIPVAATFWVAQSQVWNTYNFWVQDHIELHIGNWQMPIPWLQSLDGLAPLLTIPIVIAFWYWQAKRGREPNDFVKVAIGCFIFGAATWWLGLASLVYTHGRAPLLWAVVFHVVSNLGWVYFSPTMTAIFSRLAPASVNATMIGLLLFSVTIGSFVSGRLGALYETISPATFWTIHAAIVGLGGAVFLAIGAGMRLRTRAQEASLD
jgi:POT family proton-dependent oligopeptide transporter